MCLLLYCDDMDKKYQKSIFIFRRDLRLQDNLGLLTALNLSETVIPLFIFDPKQIDRDKNEYFSEPAFDFMVNSLAELSDELKNKNSHLYICHGDPSSVVENLLKKDGVDAVYVNKDYTPFSRKRDGALLDICTKYNVPFSRHEDCALTSLENIRTEQGKIYTVFTPFMKKAMGQAIPKPQKNTLSNYFSTPLKTPISSLADYPTNPAPKQIHRGGRKEALKLLKKRDYLKNYKEGRNLPATLGTSTLSPHHKFGTVSIRESYHMAEKHAGKHSQFISELYWRDFYFYIAYHFPIVFKKSFLPWAKEIVWINDKNQFAAWCEGKTGVPMVDAGMRELNETGWMHNRSRMIVASYLTKNLLIDWRCGEKYFATKLIDYDPSQNNGGWQWSASTGADQRPLRIFNPYTQAVKYDPDAVYIKKWVPELQEVESQKLTDGKTQDLSILASDYPEPLVDQKESYHRVREVYKQAKTAYNKKLT